MATGIQEHNEEKVNKSVLEELTASQHGIYNSLSAALDTIVVSIVHKLVNSWDFITSFSDGNSGLVVQVVLLVK